MTTPNESRHDLVFWARFTIDQTPPDAFLEIREEALLRDAEYASAALLEQLVPAANPYLPGRVAKHCVHFDGQDLLGHTYAVDSLWLSVTESSSFALVRPDVDLGPPEGHLEAARRVAALLFRAAAFAPLHPKPFKAADESLRFSTDPSPALGMPERGAIDGGVANGKLYFVLHKLADPRARAIGYPPPTGWLSRGLRAAWDARPASR